MKKKKMRKQNDADQMKVRIEIQLTIEYADIMNVIAQEHGRTRKNFVESLCLKEIHDFVSLKKRALAKSKK